MTNRKKVTPVVNARSTKEGQLAARAADQGGAPLLTPSMCHCEVEMGVDENHQGAAPYVELVSHMATKPKDAELIVGRLWLVLSVIADAFARDGAYLPWRSEDSCRATDYQARENSGGGTRNV